MTKGHTTLYLVICVLSHLIKSNRNYELKVDFFTYIFEHGHMCNYAFC